MKSKQQREISIEELSQEELSELSFMENFDSTYEYSVLDNVITVSSEILGGSEHENV